MFQFPRSTLMQLFIHYMMHGVSHASSLIRKSPDLWLCAPTRSLSQLITSFIGSWCQGIHHAPFVAWPYVCLLISITASTSSLWYSCTRSTFRSLAPCFLVLELTRLHSYVRLLGFITASASSFKCSRTISTLRAFSPRFLVLNPTRLHFAIVYF